MPKVSICLPNLYHAEYLADRFDSILAQTFQDWTCFVYDSYSDDGSWEIICDYAQRDARFTARQGPREGIYPAWNRCIEECSGQYVYIATSDDTMAEDCLEKMVKAMDSHPECGIAHCALKAIGEGAEVFNHLWESDSLFAKSSGCLREQPHVRRAPLDALLQLSGNTVYISITQLLIRKALFERIGLFDGRWGPAGDFHWHMRASLVTDTIHVPSTWGGWRLHSSQATCPASMSTPAYRAKIEEMIDDALRLSWDALPGEIRIGLVNGWRRALHDQWHLNRVFPTLKGKIAKAIFLARESFGGSVAARSAFMKKLFGVSVENPEPHLKVVQWLRSVGRDDFLVLADDVLPRSSHEPLGCSSVPGEHC